MEPDPSPPSSPPPPAPSSPPRPPRGRLRRAAVSIARIGLLLVLVLVGCQSRLIYFPRPYDPDQLAEFSRDGGKPLEYTTGEGSQTAWLKLPARGGPPERVWIVCGGNGSLSLDLRDEIESNALRDAVLYFDYPGYGKCEGSARPARIRDSLRAVWPLAAQQLGLTIPEMTEKGRFFGHSLGAAVALMAGEEFNLTRGVLISPFTSTMDMARVMLKLPVGFLVWHRYNNLETLAAVAGRPGADIRIIHGTDDEVIPVSMGRDLAASQPDAVTFTEVPRARHNDVFAPGALLIRDAIQSVK